MESLRDDLALALRGLRRHPGFALAAIATLAIGIASTTAVFSVVDGVLLRPLAFPEPDRLLRVGEHHARSTGISNLTNATFLDVRAQARAVELAAWRPFPVNLAGDRPERVPAALVTARFFEVVGVPPALGRGFSPDEEQPGRDAVAVLSHALWVTRFGADPGVLGRTLETGDGPLEVVGVMPPRFDLPAGTALWAPLVTQGERSANRRAHLLSVVARLAPGRDLPQARDELARLAAAIERDHPGADPGLGLQAETLHERLTGAWRPGLLALLGAVGLVLLVACADVGGLLLVRGAARERELAVRAALGASTGSLARLLLVESLLLSAVAGAAGVGLAAALQPALRALAPEGLPRAAEIGFDARTAAVGLGAALATGALFGLVPVLRLRRPRLREALSDGRRGTTGREGRLGGALVVAQVALTAALLVGAALMIRTLEGLARVDPGYDARDVVSLPLFLPDSTDAESQRALFEPLLEWIRSRPGVEDAALVNVAPMDPGPATSYAIPDAPPDAALPGELVAVRVVDSAFFRTLRVPLLRGRGFDERDGAGGIPSLIVNRRLAEAHWAGQDPIGRRLTMKEWGPPLTGVVIGVVPDLRLDGPDAPAPPTLYWSYPEFPTRFNTLLVRSARPVGELVPLVAERLQQLAPGQPLGAPRTLASIAAGRSGERRFAARLLALFSAAALLLSGVGLYGAVAYALSRRTRELGVRSALGAGRGDLAALVLGGGLRLAALGLIAGMPLALGLSRALRHMLFGVAAADPFSYASAAGVVAIAMAAACALPALGAARLDPVRALAKE